MIKLLYYLNWIWTTIFVSYNIVYFTCLEKIPTFKLGYQVMVWLLVLLIWLVLIFFSLGAGYPNNKINKIIYLDPTRNKNKSLTLQVKEIEKNKWQIFDNFYNEIFDMKGWVKQKSFITLLVRTKIMLDIYNREKQKRNTLPFGNQNSPLEGLTLVFLSQRGRESKRVIIKNHKVIKSIYLRIKAYVTTARKARNRYEEFQLKDFYFIKKKNRVDRW